MRGYRQAAVALHGMNREDRAWLLGELDRGQCAVLEGLMRELDELGFPAAPDLAGSDLGGPAVPLNGPRETLALAPAEDVAAVLEREPVLLVAQLLNVCDWPWTEQLLASLAAPRRSAIRAAMAGVSAAPSRDRFLIEQLAARLGRQATPVDVRPARGTSIVERVRRWIR
ncbi:hypothetical protein [Massilia luteola]|uniref:hypothetical protein n=1 Tax=Massilia luteola TaxID=3081751 RepID=UPI002ACC17CE|nr:hypothetical protein [Massilia sp. Gc5]